MSAGAPQNLRETVAEDREGLIQQAHQLKGAAGNMGGMAVQAIAAALEQAAREEDATAAWAKLPELEAQIEALMEALQDYLASL